MSCEKQCQTENFSGRDVGIQVPEQARWDKKNFECVKIMKNKNKWITAGTDYVKGRSTGIDKKARRQYIIGTHRQIQVNSNMIIKELAQNSKQHQEYNPCKKLKVQLKV